MSPTPPSSRLISAPIVVMVLGLICSVVGVYWFAHNSAAANATDLPYDQFSVKLDHDQIYQDERHPLDLLIEEGSSTQTLTGYFSDLPPAKEHLDRLQAFHTTISLDYDKDLQKVLNAKELTPHIRNKSNLPATTLLGFLPILIFLLIAVSVLCLGIWLLFELISRLNGRRGPANPR